MKPGQHLRTDQRVSYNAYLCANAITAFETSPHQSQAVGRLIEMASASSHSEGSRVGEDRQLGMQASGEAFGEVSARGGVGFVGAQLGVRGRAGGSWSATDTEPTSEEFSNSLSAADRETYNTSMDQVLSAMALSQVSQTGGTQNSRVNSIQQDVRQSEDYQTRADRALRQSEQASEQARRYESDSFRYDAPLHDQLLEFYGNQVGGHGQLNRSMQGWQGGLNEMYHMDRVVLRPIFELLS